MPRQKTIPDYDKVAAAIGLLLEAVNTKHDGSRRDAAAACGVDYITFTQICNGRIMAGEAIRSRIDRTFGIPFDSWGLN